MHKAFVLLLNSLEALSWSAPARWQDFCVNSLKLQTTPGRTSLNDLNPQKVEQINVVQWAVMALHLRYRYTSWYTFLAEQQLETMIPVLMENAKKYSDFLMFLFCSPVDRFREAWKAWETKHKLVFLLELVFCASWPNDQTLAWEMLEENGRSGSSIFTQNFALRTMFDRLVTYWIEMIDRLDCYT